MSHSVDGAKQTVGSVPVLVSASAHVFRKVPQKPRVRVHVNPSPASILNMDKNRGPKNGPKFTIIFIVRTPQKTQFWESSIWAQTLLGTRRALRPPGSLCQAAGRIFWRALGSCSFSSNATSETTSRPCRDPHPPAAAIRALSSHGSGAWSSATAGA